MIKTKPPNILIVAGEESGDLHGSNLIDALKTVQPGVSFCGMGGKKMRRAGMRSFFDIDRMGTVGLVEIFGSLFHYVKVYRKLAAEIAGKKYDAAILIDYPTLNLMLARVCKRANCPVFYFISPQIWAWRRRRIKTIRRTVKKMFVIIPFEEPLYREAGVDVEFVGHPFIELVRPTLPADDALRKFGLRPGLKTVGLLPGSRKNEIDALLEVMVEAAGKIKQDIKDCQFIIPVADSIDPDSIRRRLGANDLNIKIATSASYDVMNCCDFLVAASGSVTLEAGLIGCPMVIVYKLNRLTYWVAKRLVEVDHIGLVNIVAGERVVPELIQDEATAQNIAFEALRILKNPEYSQAVRNKLGLLRKSLGAPGVSRRIAASIAKALAPRAAHEKVVC